MRILFITSFPPFPIDRTGGGIRSKLIIDALRTLGTVGIFYLDYRVDNRLHELSTLLTDRSLMVEQSIQMRGQRRVSALADKAFRAFGMMWGSKYAAAGLKVHPAARKAIEDLIASKKYDLIVGRLSRPTATSGVLEAGAIRLIVDADDWEPSRFYARLNVTPWYNIPLIIYLRRAIKGSEYLGERILTRSSHVFLASDKDVELLHNAKASTLPNLPLSHKGTEIARVAPSQPESKVLFAVGLWSRAQNSDGMSWFIETCWPLILDKVPDASLRIAGHVPDSLTKRWANRGNVKLVGFVNDLAQEYEQAASIVTPITWGGGTKIKVLEALAYGRVPAGTLHAFEGLAKESSLEGVVVKSDNPRILADGIVHLILDCKSRILKERAIAEYYSNNYSIDRFNTTLRSVVLGI